jgi:uncharacterized protein (TIGR02646 family)
MSNRNEPEETRWTLSFDDMPGDVSQAVMNSMLAEQGWLCAYTGRRIDTANAHIEHLKAQKHCIVGQEDIDYGNLVACWPHSGYCEYGAYQKGDWPSPTNSSLFVSPLDANCEGRFRFNYRGKISAASEDDQPAQETIKHLKLDHDELADLRRQAIRGLLEPRGKRLTLAEAQHTLDRLKARNTGQLDEYIFALKQALNKHIETEKKIKLKGHRK